MATVYLETFGCQMNELDSELVRSQLRAAGHRFIDDWRLAEVVLFNTCSVRAHAEDKAYSRLGWVGGRKRRGERVVLGVLGCMAERDGLDLLRRYPQVDLMCGPGELDRLPLLVDNSLRTPGGSLDDRVALAGDRTRRSATLAAVEDSLEALDLSRAFDPDSREGSPWAAHVRITRGCNKFCTYCVVPNTRGAEVHRPPDHVVDECRRLVDAGVCEITLLGQTVNHYRYSHGTAIGMDGREAPQVGPGLAAFRAGAPSGGARTTTFADLLRRIHDEVPGLARLRFVTSYPRDFGDDILGVMAECPRICRYIHAPAQSGSDRILRLMNRGYSVQEYRDFVARVLARLPDATLAGDFIVGFPTETEEDFDASVDLIRSLPFKNNFSFKYSARPGTVAIDRFADDVPTEVKKLRNNRMLAVQAETSRRVHEQWVGRTVEVLVERVEDTPGEATLPAPSGRATASATLTVLGQPAWAARTDRSEGSVTGGRAGRATGRTKGDLIVDLDAGEGATRVRPGDRVPVLVESAGSLLLHGRRILPSP